MKTFAIIGVPSSAGSRRTGQEGAPNSFRRAGLIGALRAQGLKVQDFGDLPEVRFRPDREHPKAQNLALVLDVVKQVARQVQMAVRDNVIPIVLGGDCTISLGVVAGLIPHTPHLGIMYLDGDLDLNTPETTPSGIFDGMVMAHVTGKGADSLARCGPRYPLMAEQDIALFGFNNDAGSIDAAEIEALQGSQFMQFPLARIRGKAKVAASDALKQLENRADALLVHFDVDVVDFAEFPAADVPHATGLSVRETMTALEVFVSSDKLVGLVITEFNAERDGNGVLAKQLVNAVANTLRRHAS